MNTCPTFTATIYCGLRTGYDDPVATADDAAKIAQRYVDAVSLCVTLTRTEFIYTNGGEPGIIVGLIDYPRFPKGAAEVRRHALELARLLMNGLGQQRVSVVMTDETVMLEVKS